MSSAACFSSMMILVMGVSGTRGLLGLSGDTWRTPSTSVCVCERERVLNRMSYLIMHVVCRSSVTAMSSVYLSQVTSFGGYAQPCNSLLDLLCIISTIMAASGSRFEVWLLICCLSRDRGGFHSRGTRRSLYITN